MVLFMVQLLFGLLAGLQPIRPGFHCNMLGLNVNRMVWISAMDVVWLYRFDITAACVFLLFITIAFSFEVQQSC